MLLENVTYQSYRYEEPEPNAAVASFRSTEMVPDVDNVSMALATSCPVALCAKYGDQLDPARARRKNPASQERELEILEPQRHHHFEHHVDLLLP